MKMTDLSTESTVQLLPDGFLDGLGCLMGLAKFSRILTE